MKLLTADLFESHPRTLQLSNDADPQSVDLQGIDRIELVFPKFTDGRAYSQAFLLRRRLGFAGELVATGDVLIDQLALMQRCGFDTAVLRADQPTEIALRVLQDYPGFNAGTYQGDALQLTPRFAKALS